MTIASEVTRIKNNIESAYTKCEEKGATLPETHNSDNLAACVESIPVLRGQVKTITENGVYTPDTGYNGFTEVTVNTPGGIIREVVSGVYQAPPTLNFTFRLPSSATDIAAYALQSVYRNCTGLTSIDFSSLTTVSGNDAMYNAFNGCSNLTSVDLSSLTTISGNSAMYNAFNGCSNLTSVDLSSLSTISGSIAMRYAFQECTSLTSLSFPALKSTSFGTNTNQFNNMLIGVTGCTVHFPSNLQSVISSWSDVTAGFGGTNTTILFDLSATS